jgi:hypothetical protein
MRARFIRTPFVLTSGQLYRKPAAAEFLVLENEEKDNDASEQANFLSKELVAGSAKPFRRQAVRFHRISGKLIWHDCCILRQEEPSVKFNVSGQLAA